MSVSCDNLTREQRRRAMQSVRHFDTPVEVRLRRALWRRGLRYRVHRRVVGTRPDIVFIGSKVAIFVDGCFWHGCPIHYTAPVSNAHFWKLKVDRNRERDRGNDAALLAEGWTVCRYWECEVNNELERVVEEVEGVVREKCAPISVA